MGDPENLTSEGRMKGQSPQEANSGPWPSTLLTVYACVTTTAGGQHLSVASNAW